MIDLRPHAAFSRSATVLEPWVDYNGHMGDFAYAIAFSETVTAYMDEIGLDPAWRSRTRSTLYTLDLRIGYLKECHLGAALHLSLHVLEVDVKRLLIYQEMHDDAGALLAWNGQVLLHVSQTGGTPRAAPFPDRVAARLAQDALRSAPIQPIAAMARPMGLRAGREGAG